MVALVLFLFKFISTYYMFIVWLYVGYIFVIFYLSFSSVRFELQVVLTMSTCLEVVSNYWGNG